MQILFIKYLVAPDRTWGNFLRSELSGRPLAGMKSSVTNLARNSTASITRDLQLLSLARGDMISDGKFRDPGKLGESSKTTPINFPAVKSITQAWDQTLPIELAEGSHSMTFSMSKVTDPADQPALTEYIRELYRHNARDFRIELDDDLNLLPEWKLGALVMGGHSFCPSDVPFELATQGNYRVLSWMRTCGGFSHDDSDRRWNSKTILEMLSTACDHGGDIKNVEAIADLVYDERYWTCVEDRVNFPINGFLMQCAGPRRHEVLAWFLDRGQFRYPVGKFETNFCGESDVRHLLEYADGCISRGGENREIGIKLKTFVQAHVHQKQRSRL